MRKIRTLGRFGRRSIAGDTGNSSSHFWLQSTRSFGHQGANLETRLAGELPNFQLEQKAKHGYTFRNLSDASGSQVIVFLGSNYLLDFKAQLKYELPAIQLTNKTLYPALQALEVDLRLVATGFADATIGLEQCFELTEKYKLPTPLYYVRDIPQSSPLQHQIPVTAFQDHSFVITPGNYIEQQFDHNEHPSVLARCEEIIRVIEGPQENASP